MQSPCPGAARFAGLLELVFDELAILDYEVTVEYTEGNQNRSASYGKVLPGCEGKVLYKALASGEAFEDWHQWVPADAISYSLHTGVNLHPIYEGAIKVIRQEFPEAEEGLEQFEQMQKQVGVHLDRDILQAFSGESVSITLPAASPATLGGSDSVVALRCHKPERIRELVHRAFSLIGQNQFAKDQRLQLTACEGLEGFEQVSAVLLDAFGVKPVIGFQDGWMILGSNRSAVEAVLAAKAGKAKTVADTDALDRFNLQVEGPVLAISYTNLAESTRNAAQALSQAGALGHLILGMVGSQANAEELKPVQEVLALLPDVAKIVAKFDFLEEQVSVTQDGDDPTVYTRRSVILVREKSGE